MDMVFDKISGGQNGNNPIPFIRLQKILGGVPNFTKNGPRRVYKENLNG